MAAPRQLYVDPTAGVNFATGGLTLADPYLTIQFCIDDITTSHGGRNAANGDQINVIEGVNDDILAATLDLATVGAVYGNPAADAPLIFRGCDVYGNYGIGGIDGGAGGFSIYDGNAGATDYVHFINMHVHNTGANEILYLGNNSSAINCEINTNTASWACVAGWDCSILDCHIYDAPAQDVLSVNNYTVVEGNMIEVDGAGRAAIFAAGTMHQIRRNLFVVNHLTAIGVKVSNTRQQVIGNSILCTVAGTGTGIFYDAVGHFGTHVRDNLIEGFSGAGGAGIDFGTSTQHIQMFANNSFFNNENDIRVATDCDKNYDEDNDLIMAASPFLKEGALTFANRFNYFKPAIPVRGRAFPNGSRFDRGAVQVRLAVERTVAEQVIATIPERVVLDSL